MPYDGAMNNGLILARLKNVTGINFACYAPLPSFQDMQEAMQSFIACDVSPYDEGFYRMEEAARSIGTADTDPKAFKLYAEMVKFYAQIKDGKLPRDKAFKYLDDAFFPAPEHPTHKTRAYKNTLHQ